MADFLDIEEMLEAPYRNESSIAAFSSNSVLKLTSNSDRSPEPSRSRKDRNDGRDNRRRSRSKERRERRKSRSRSRDRRSRDVERERDRDKDRDRDRRRRHSKSRSRSRERDRRRGTSRDHFDVRDKRRKSPSPILTPEERDARTVFVWQLSARIRPRDLEDFFSAVGEVRDVRLIMDNKTRRSKGIAYVEFRDCASLPLAIALCGTKLLGVPIQIQASQAEKNRAGQPSTILASLTGANVPGLGVMPEPVAPSRSASGRSLGPVKLYVGCLHPHITEDMLRSIFQPFGDIEDIQLTKNLITGQSVGSGHVVFRRPESAHKALEQLNGFELAGKTMKVSTVPDAVRQEPIMPDAAASILTNVFGALNNPIISSMAAAMGTTALNPSASLLDTANLALIANLGGPTASQSFQQEPVASNNTPSNPALDQPSVQTPCFMLTNMFSSEQVPKEPNLPKELRSDVIEECSVHGGVVHVFVDADSPEGNIYCKARSTSVATACVKALHGRFFSGRLITAAYIPMDSYHELFPDSVNATEILGR